MSLLISAIILHAISSGRLSSYTRSAGEKRQCARNEGEKYPEEERRGIDLFLTANQFNNSVNGETHSEFGEG